MHATTSFAHGRDHSIAHRTNQRTQHRQRNPRCLPKMDQPRRRDRHTATASDNHHRSCLSPRLFSPRFQSADFADFRRFRGRTSIATPMTAALCGALESVSTNSVILVSPGVRARVNVVVHALVGGFTSSPFLSSLPAIEGAFLAHLSCLGQASRPQEEARRRSRSRRTLRL